MILHPRFGNVLVVPARVARVLSHVDNHNDDDIRDENPRPINSSADSTVGPTANDDSPLFGYNLTPASIRST